MVKIKMPMHAHQALNQSPAINSMNNSYADYSQAGNENSFSESQLSSNNNSDNAKLWDNDELVMKALRVYGKMPRPQVFNEISRVCKLSNLRKSRYFHEKMMKNNPFKDKIMKIIAEEGEHNYPYFKIFFEEYKTKKQRLSLINNENVVDSNGYGVKKENSNPLGLPKLDHSVENSVENSNDYENSCSDQVYYHNDEVCTENYDYNPDDYDNAEMTGVDEDQYAGHNETEYDATENMNGYDNTDNQDYHNGEAVAIATATAAGRHQIQMAPLVQSNSTYLENLELKLKILNKEKEHMVDYFKTFTTVITNLKSEIDLAKSGGGEAGVNEGRDGADFKLDKSSIRGDNLNCLVEQMRELEGYVTQLQTDSSKLGREQAVLREELKVTRNYASGENAKLQEEVNSCKAQLACREEEVRGLKQRLEEATRQNRAASAKHAALQSGAGVAKGKLSELRESMDRMFAQIQGLSS